MATAISPVRSLARSFVFCYLAPKFKRKHSNRPLNSPGTDRFRDRFVANGRAEKLKRETAEPKSVSNHGSRAQTHCRTGNHRTEPAILRMDTERRPRLAGSLQTYTITPEAYSLSGSLFDTTLKWDAFLKARETKQFFLLYVSSRWAHFIPKAAISSGSDLCRIRSIIREKLGSRAHLSAETRYAFDVDLSVGTFVIRPQQTNEARSRLNKIVAKTGNSTAKI